MIPRTATPGNRIPCYSGMPDFRLTPVNRSPLGDSGKLDFLVTPGPIFPVFRVTPGSRIPSSSGKVESTG